MHSTFRGIFTLALALLAFGACRPQNRSAEAPPPKLATPEVKAEATPEPSIGVATMQDDGTIVVRLRYKSDGGAIGEGQVSYTRDNPDYQSILDHIAPIKKGETVTVKPWPEKK